MIRPPELYPPIEPYRSGRLVVDPIHTLYWEECGNPGGVPVVFLHGGPGAGCSPDHRRFFDPQHYRIVLFDQRGAGRSTPHGEVGNNTTAHLINDMELLRGLLKIQAWHVFGGSWGATLAIAYAEEHPHACLSLTLRGVFLLQASEIEWFLRGVRHFAPQAWGDFVNFLPARLRGDICEGYWTLLNDPASDVRLAAANSWATYEGRCATLRPSAKMMAEAGDVHTALGLARLEVHYMRANRFTPDDLLLQRVQRIRHVPCAIVQGKYDLLCPPITAAALHEAWPESTLQIIDDAGHSAHEPGIRAALVAVMDGRVAQQADRRAGD
ncbi:MAG TPA: prolyl aminopeptidase [Steroidobacteraceae bacterium]|nr:prolyl aminopeptidase [Steroidobacteraceae bacterium]